MVRHFIFLFFLLLLWLSVVRMASSLWIFRGFCVLEHNCAARTNLSWMMRTRAYVICSVCCISGAKQVIAVPALQVQVVSQSSSRDCCYHLLSVFLPFWSFHDGNYVTFRIREIRFLSLFLFLAAPTACGSSQARNQTHAITLTIPAAPPGNAKKLFKNHIFQLFFFF